jgi:hypothetical protein
MASSRKDDMKDDNSRDGMADDDKKSDRSLMKDQSMDKKAMTNDTMKTKLNLETIVKHLMSSNSTCPAGENNVAYKNNTNEYHLCLNNSI